MATFPTTGQTPYGPALKAYVDSTAIEVSALRYDVKVSNSAATNSTNLAALFAANTGASLTVTFPEAGIYNFSSPLPTRSFVTYRGAASTYFGISPGPTSGTQLNWTSGSAFSPGNTFTQSITFEDLALTCTGSGSHLFDFGTGNNGWAYIKFQRVSFYPQVNASSIIKALNVQNFFRVDFHDCQFWRTSTATVSGLNLTSNSSGLNSITFDSCMFHSQGGTGGGPMIRMESTAVSSYVLGISLQNCLGEQNASGLFHGFGMNSLVVYNVIEMDTSTYTDDLFKVATGSGGAQSYNCRFDHFGTAGAVTFSAGKHLNIASGNGHYIGRAVHGATSDMTITNPGGSNLREHMSALVQGLSGVTTNTTLDRSYRLVLANGSSITITLPAASSMPVGREFIVKNLHATSCTLASAGGNIDGVATKSIAQFAALSVVSDGGNWFTF